MTNEEADAFQSWKAIDGATAFLLIERHAGDHQEAGAMMQAWARAHYATVPAENDADDLYWRLHSMSKLLEGSGVIDEHDNPDAYATVLDALNFVRSHGEILKQAKLEEAYNHYE